VCKYIVVLGRNTWYYIQRDQRLGICDHLANIDGYFVWHYRATTEKNPSTIERIMNAYMNHFIEIRSYTLKPGTRDTFHRLFIEEAFPLLQRWNVDVVAYGPSLHDENSYYLIRRFDSLAQREQSEDAFYSSDEWRKGPRESIVALIENYTETVIEVDEVTLQGMRK
jgi:hypothetical protein